MNRQNMITSHDKRQQNIMCAFTGHAVQQTHNVLCCGRQYEVRLRSFSEDMAVYMPKKIMTVNSPHKSQWRGALMFSLIWA